MDFLGQNEMPSTDDSEIKEPSHKIEDYNNLPGEKDTQLIYEAQEKRKKVEPEHRGREVCWHRKQCSCLYRKN